MNYDDLLRQYCDKHENKAEKRKREIQEIKVREAEAREKTLSAWRAQIVKLFGSPDGELPPSRTTCLQNGRYRTEVTIPEVFIPPEFRGYGIYRSFIYAINIVHVYIPKGAIAISWKTVIGVLHTNVSFIYEISA